MPTESFIEGSHTTPAIPKTSLRVAAKLVAPAGPLEASAGVIRSSPCDADVSRSDSVAPAPIRSAAARLYASQ